MLYHADHTEEICFKLLFDFFKRAFFHSSTQAVTSIIDQYINFSKTFDTLCYGVGNFLFFCNV